MTRALIPVTVVTMFIVGIQLAIFSNLRFAGVVFMLVWLWPFTLGLAGFTTLSIVAAIVSGVFFDTHADDALRADRDGGRRARLRRVAPR